jgi:hypothetical protein
MMDNIDTRAAARTIHSVCLIADKIADYTSIYDMIGSIADVSQSGFDVLQCMHCDLGLRGAESDDEDLCSEMIADAADVVLAALRAGLQSGLTIADLLKLFNTAVEQPIRPELCEETD